MSCRDDLEALKRWLEFRVWAVCASQSPDVEMTQEQFAQRSGISKASISGIVTRKANIGEDLWPLLVDFFELTPEHAFKRARIWWGTEQSKRWVSGLQPIAPHDLPLATPPLLAAMEQLAGEGTIIHEVVIEHARDSLRPRANRPRQRDRSATEWRHELVAMQRLFEEGHLHAMAASSRSVRERTRRLPGAIPARPKTLSRSASEPPKK